MKFSLIIGTLNRLSSLKNCIDSLRKQTFRDFEIIIIDQSDDDQTEKYVESIDDLNIVYKHVDYRGLSRARNDALKLSSGDYFCLIDDDAYYNDDYLQVASLYVERKCILSGYIFDNNTQSSFAKYKKRYNHSILSTRMIIKTCPSAALIIPYQLVNEIGAFDEKFGVGSKYPAGEETDLLLRGKQKGYKVKYIEELRLNHPFPVSKSYISSDKLARYYIGIGALYKKNMMSRAGIGLIMCFLEVWIKFVVKSLLFFRYKRDDVKKQLAGFKSGFFDYTKAAE